jgi:preprotein translocase subunit SecG
MEKVSLIRVISGVMFVLVLFILIQRQKSRAKRG